MAYKVKQNTELKATYTYIADGTKAGVVDDSNNGFVYLGSMVYNKNGSDIELESTSFGGGRINATNSNYEVNYFITDHLGSTRVVVNQDGTVLGRNNYYPFGKLLEGSNTQVPTTRYTFSGKEIQTTGDVNYLDFGARMYDDFICRWFTLDPMAEKYYGISPYVYCANNPIMFIDLHGDSVDMARILIYDRNNKTNYAQTIADDLRSQTGLSISIGVDFKMVYDKDENGQPLIETTTDANGNTVLAGSATARAHLVGLIDDENTVTVGVSNKGSAGIRNNVWLDPSDINSAISGSVNIDGRTFGWGMTFLHESYHTKIGGGLPDDPYNPGPVVTKMNIIRFELNTQGGNYGQRLDYHKTTLGTNSYIPFCKNAKASIEGGIRPSRREKFIQYTP